VGRLIGKNVVISGVGSGIGLEASTVLCNEGARVVGVARSKDIGGALESELRAKGHDFTYVRADVSDEQDVAALARQVEALFGGLDVLVNNAGVAVGNHILQTTDEEWDRVQAAAVRGSFLMTRALGQLMGQGGSIINMSSTGGLVALPNMAAYCASKGAVLAMTRAMAVELAPQIRVNAICPGAIDTPMSWQLYGEVPGKTVDEVATGFAGAHLVKRLGRPDEVCRLIVFLASDEASFMTGAGVAVDGGFTTV
jgi:NAD(P)-dependent dehydrogenase (short-subunit alcohol dehydrogenase family)